MYRARREIQPTVPKSALEFSTIIKDCLAFNQYFKETVVVGEDCSKILYSENVYECLSCATNIYFDGTFKSVLSNYSSSGHYLINLEEMCYLQFTA